MSAPNFGETPPPIPINTTGHHFEDDDLITHHTALTLRLAKGRCAGKSRSPAELVCEITLQRTIELPIESLSLIIGERQQNLDEVLRAHVANLR
jgi:hypothetical protein